nr:hypothetical protein CFP56_35605 [Quercus suber]
MKKMLTGLQTITTDSIHYDAQLKNNNKYFHNMVVLKPPLQNPLKLASDDFDKHNSTFNSSRAQTIS